MSELPRILICSFDVVPSPTGPSRRATEYLRGLNGRYSVVFMTTKTPDVSHIEKYHGARLLRVPVGTGDLASRIQAFERAVRRQLESEEYVLVHFTDPFGGYTLTELRQDYGYRILYQALSFPSQELGATHPQLAGDRRFLARVRRQELYCLMNADLVLTGSRHSAEHIRQLGVAEGQIRVGRAAVDLGAYAAKAIGEPVGQPMRILYLGSQASWQGLPTLLRAMQRVVASTPAKLSVVGPRHSSWQKQLQDLCIELGLLDAVRFEAPGPVDDLPDLLAASDVGVVPLADCERNRAQGGSVAKIADYLAAGRPVVASDLPVTRELVPQGAGRFHPPGDAAALAEILVDLAAHPEARAEMGKVARTEAQRLVSAADARAILLDAYGTLLRMSGIAPIIEPRDARDDNPTATPTRPTGSGPPPAHRLPLERGPAAGPLGDAPSTDPSATPVEEYTYPSLPGPRWSADAGSRWKTRSGKDQDWTPTGLRRSPDEPEEISADEIEEAFPDLPPSEDPWLTQLVHGYCPPEGIQFARPTPPPHLPGREPSGPPARPGGIKPS